MKTAFPEPWCDAFLAEVRATLETWYREHRRHLPWRERQDPYATWVSEIMLQQTRVETVVPYFEQFMRRFPTVAALAAAPLDDVLAAWSGLGYYRRARNLHAAARIVVEQHGGRIPSELAELQRLPGIGRYTAGAIRSIGFDLPAPILDGNIMRLLSRIGAMPGDPRQGLLQRRLWELAARLSESEHPADISQALMEQGALVCLPGRPRCSECALRRHCAARAAGDPQRYPELAAAREAVAVTHACIVVARRGRYLIGRVPAGEHWEGLWEFPRVAAADGETPEAAAVRAGAERVGLTVTQRRELKRVRHAVTHHRITLHAFRCEAAGRAQPRGYDAVRWVTLAELPAIALSSPQRRIVNVLLSELTQPALALEVE